MVSYVSHCFGTAIGQLGKECDGFFRHSGEPGRSRRLVFSRSVFVIFVQLEALAWNHQDFAGCLREPFPTKGYRQAHINRQEPSQFAKQFPTLQENVSTSSHHAFFHFFHFFHLQMDSASSAHRASRARHSSPRSHGLRYVRTLLIITSC